MTCCIFPEHRNQCFRSYANYHPVPSLSLFKKFCLCLSVRENNYNFGARPAAPQKQEPPPGCGNHMLPRGNPVLPETKGSVLETCPQERQTPSRNATSDAAPAPPPRPCTRTAAAARSPPGWAARRRPGWRRNAPSPRSSCSAPAGVERGWQGSPVRARRSSQSLTSVPLVVCLFYRD